MVDSILYGIAIKATYDLLKFGFLRGIRDPKDFETIYKETLKDISAKYNVVISDLREFFNLKNLRNNWSCILKI